MRPKREAPIRHRRPPQRRRARHTQAGQTIAEFAFVAPILFAVIFAILQFSIVVVTKSTLTNAVRDAGRTASIHASESNSNDEICTSLRDSLATDRLDPNNLGTITIYNAISPTLQDVGACTSSGWTYSVPGGGAGWPPYERSVIDPPPPVGIFVSYNFHFLMPMFGTGLTLSDGTILRVEPLYAVGSNSLTLPTAQPTYTSTPYPTATTYPAPTPYPTATCAAIYVATSTPTNDPANTNTPVGNPTATPMPTATTVPYVNGIGCQP
jgi:hypothetical protein